MDLNLVTTTLHRNFAMKNLVLPIDIKDGYLTVAAPYPLNLEVLDDLVKVTNLKVKTVLSSKSDIVKLLNEFFGFKSSIQQQKTCLPGRRWTWAIWNSMCG